MLMTITTHSRATSANAASANPPDAGGTAATPPRFTPPSPGAWELEQTHLSRPISVFMAEIFPPNMMRGFRDGSRAYGILLDYLDVAVINRFVYMAPRPVGAPKGAKGPPPRPVFWLLQRVHPELRRRIARASEVLRDRHWRKEFAWWNSDVKPGIAAEAQALLAEDVATMSDGALADHVRRAADFGGRTIYWHHRFNTCVMLPVGNLLVHTMKWTGLGAEVILGVMRGLSPVSAGATDELETLRAAITANPEATAVLMSHRPPDEILSELTTRPATAAAARRYLDVVGLRVLGGYDVADRHAREHPDMLVRVVRTAVTAQRDGSRRAAAAERVAELRERVPGEHRAQFDELLQEAQLTYGIRDERIFHGDGLGMGVLRRALLAAGERLQSRGRVLDPAHMADASLAEVTALLEGRDGPSAAELARRFTWRMETPLSAAPARLGLPPSAPPPAEWLPDAAAQLQRVTALVLQLMFETRAPEPAAARTLKGFGVSPGQTEGRARVVKNVSELPSVEAGEILVTTSTGPTFNVVLPLISGLITERGGALSHPAIVAREYGLPGIVGCPGATQAIRTGSRVRMDGATGEVWILD